MPKYVLLTSLTVLSLIVSGIFISSTKAQQGITVSPPLHEIVIKPGLISTSVDLSIKNNTGETVTAEYRLVDLKTLGQYGGNSLDEAGLTDDYGLANWMSLTKSEPTIHDGERKTITLKIENRDDLTPGGHYGAVIMNFTPYGKQESSLVLNQQIVSLIFIKKLGGQNYGLHLENKELTPQNAIPSSASLTFKNTGNVHVVPRGYIEIHGPSGGLISKGIINPESALILPSAKQKFEVTFKEVEKSRQSGKHTAYIYYRHDDNDTFHLDKLEFEVEHKLSKIMLSGLVMLIIGGLTLLLTNVKPRKKPSL